MKQMFPIRPFMRSHLLSPQWLRCALLGLLAGLAWNAALADTALVSVSAVVLSKNQCKLNAKSATLAFGTIDPSSTANATASTSLTMRCVGSSPTAAFSITHDGGLYGLSVGANRLRHATLTRYLPYQFSVSPAAGTVARNTDQTITVSGTMTPSDFGDATPGVYSDTVTLTLLP
jgi:spore coat protein U-like protein